MILRSIGEWVQQKVTDLAGSDEGGARVPPFAMKLKYIGNIDRKN